MTASYAGVRRINLRTFTSTFSALHSPWTWQPNSLMPMEMAGQLVNTGSGFYASGFGCTVFDHSIGSTRFTYGDLTLGTYNDVFGNILWRRSDKASGLLCGWVFDQVNDQTPSNFSSAVTLGVPVNNPQFSTQSNFQTPSATNSGTPDPYSGGGWFMTYSGSSESYQYSSWRNNLTQSYMNWKVLGSAITQLGTLICNFNATKNFISCIPYGATYTYCWCEDATGPGTKTLVATDFISYAVNYAPSLSNPIASSIDLNAYINDVGTASPSACYGGWLWMNKNNLTVAGKTLTGFGIWVAPDFSSYYLLEIVPIDAYASTWNSGVGTVFGKWDDTGALWLKSSNNFTDIFVSVPPSSVVVPISPPVKIPTPPPDTQIPLKLFEGK